MMIKECSLYLLEQALQQALACDPHNADRQYKLQGKVLKVIINPLQANFYLSFTPSLRLYATYEGNIDTTIHTSPLGLIRLSLLPPSPSRSLFNRQVKISGDLAFGQAIQTLFHPLEVDWEGHLARFTGDVIAHTLGQWTRQAQHQQHTCRTRLQRQCREYLEEEARLYPSLEEMQDFMDDVDALSLRLERLEARLHHALRTS